MPTPESETSQPQLTGLAQTLLSELHRLQEMVQDSAIESSAMASTQLQQQVATLQKNFQHIVATLADAHLAPETEQRLRPYQTEAHRLLRLLGVAAMKMSAAKQPATIEKTRSHFAGQLDKLQPFVQAIADEVSSL